MKNTLLDEINKVTAKKSSLFKGDKFSLTDIPLGVSARSQMQFSRKGESIRVLLLGFLVLFFVVLYLIRSINLQLVENDKFLMLSEQNKTRTETVLAERGLIYSADNQLLARNKPAFALELFLPECGANCENVLKGLSNKIKIDAQIFQILSRGNNGYSSLLVAKDLSKDDILFIESNKDTFKGISVLVIPQREYAYPEAFSHVLGYVGIDDSSVSPKIVGKAGIEKSYDSFLTGLNGKKIREVDSTGNYYILKAEQSALPGRNLNLFVNAKLTSLAYETLKEKVTKKEADSGAVVAMDPVTGGVIALVSYPGFNSEQMSYGLSNEAYQALIKDTSYPFYNRAISAAYPPGSTFKMVSAAAALSEKVVTKYTSIFDPGFVSVGSFRFNNWKLDGHGDVDILRAIQVSNDTYFYTIGGGHGGIKGVGIQGLHKWARLFGIGSRTGIDLENEVQGFMPDGKHRTWYLGDTYNTSIGQGEVLATPLQMTVITSYFANGGYLVKPRIVKNVSGESMYETEVISQNLIDKTNYEIIREGLHKAVLPGGTGYPVFDFPQKHNGIELGGKTGTSEYINKDGEPDTHAWFTVFAPYNMQEVAADIKNRPIAITVFLEGGGAGSDDAAPIARTLLDEWYK